MADLFISYSRRDQQFVRELVERLSERGKDCWVDWQDIPPTAEWIQEIHTGIEASDSFVFVISPDSARSQTCRDEASHAAKLNKRIVPILRRDGEGMELPESITSLNWVLAPESVDFEEAVDRLVDALERDLENVRQHTRWLQKALEWDKSERDPSLLLRGSELNAAEEWLAGAADREPAPTPLHYEYARASRAGATRRQRLVIAALVVVLLVTLGLALAALVQRDREVAARETAESRLFAGEAVSQLQSSLDEAASLAVKAYRIKPTSAARDSVLAAVRRSAPLVGVLDPQCTSMVNVLRLSIDGSLAAAGCDNGTITLWDVENRRLLATTEIGAGVRSIAFSRDMSRLAAVDDTKKLLVWRLRENRTLERPSSVPIGAGAGAVAFTSAGPPVVGTSDGVVIARTDRPPERVVSLPYGVDKIAVASDGTIAAGGLGGAVVLSRRGGRWATTPVGGQVPVQDLSFAPFSRKLVVVEEQGVLTWEPGAKVVRLNVSGAGAAAMDRQTYLAVGELDGDVVLRDSEGRRFPADYRFRRGAAVTSIAFDGTHDLIAAATGDRIVLWRIGGSAGQRSFNLDDLDVIDVDIGM